MINRKVKAIFFIFLIMFCIASANAEPFDNNANMETETFAIAIDDGEPGSFSELNTTINEDQNKNTVELTKNYTYKEGDTDFKDGVVINRTLTIDGKGHSIDGNNAARIFNVTAGSLTLKNIKLLNAKSVNGSAIYSSSSEIITVINSTFTSNVAEGSTDYVYGGAIYSNGDVSIIDSKFRNNSASSSKRYVYGGAVYSNGHVLINNSEFDSNSINSTLGGSSGNSYIYGGAVYSKENVTVIDSIFTNNSAVSTEKGQVYGGAIYSNNNITIINSTFDFNMVMGKSHYLYGGAVYSNESIVVMNSKFKNNTAITTLGYVYGGAIYSNNNMTIINSEFANNSVNGVNYELSGGAVYANNTIVINSTFSNNFVQGRSTDHYGGAIYSNNDVEIKDSSFSFNILKKIDSYFMGVSYGGAVYSENGSVVVTNSNFTNNSAIGNTGHGGAICANGNSSIIRIIDSRFTGNKADYYGGAISGEGVVDITNSEFANNSANFYGGAVFSDGDVNIRDSSFSGNSANSLGGAVYTNAYMNMTDSNFTSNSAENNGGAVYGVELTIENSIFIGNKAEYGGAVYGYGINISDSSFNANKAVYGGAISCGSYLNAMNSNFTDNIGNHGGAILVGGAMFLPTKANITGSEFTGNSADQGGAIYIAYGNVTVDNSKFTSNNATQGGAIYNTNFYNDYREIIEILYPYTDFETYLNVLLKITNSDFSKNNGEYGDDIYTAFNTTISRNSYTENSYANIYANNTIVNCSIIKVFENRTVYVTPEGKFKVNATVFADGASINGYNMIITDGENEYNATYVGYGIYETVEDILADFMIKHYSAFVRNFTDSLNYIVENGTAIIYKINIEVLDLVKYYGNSSKFVVVLNDILGTPLVNQTLNVTINGMTYLLSTDENGTVSMSINLIPGVYEAIVSFENVTKNATITILSTIEAQDIVKYFMNGTHYVAEFLNVDGTPLANTEVSFNINGILYTRKTDENGIARLNINLNPGEYILTALNPVNNESKSNIITVLSTIFAENVDKFYRNGTQYYAYVLDENGNPLANANVTFNIHGVFYNRTSNEEGMVKLNINLNPGEYIITAWNLWNGEAKSNNITVYNVVLTEDLEMTAQSRKPFKVTILGEQGKPLANANVTFNIHGVFYHRTTDANGQVSLNINLIAGKYIITTYYNEYAVSNTITVK